MIPQVRDAMLRIASMDSLNAARGGGPILFSLGILDPGTWWGEPEELGTAIKDRILVTGMEFHKRWVDAANELVASSTMMHDPSILSASILRMAAVELVCVKGSQNPKLANS